MPFAEIVSMRLIMTLLVRDEIDILRSHLEYHLAQGVDFFIVTDNRSVDGTLDLVQEYVDRGVAHLVEEQDDDYAQAKWVTRMARVAVDEYKADWVVHSDADEFWCASDPRLTLRSALEQVPDDVAAIQVSRSNFLPVPEFDGDRRPFWSRMVIRERQSLNAVGVPLPPKVCHRGLANLSVTQGNHEVLLAGQPLSRASSLLRIMHFPLRTRSQFEAKIKSGGAAYERNSELPERTGITWRRLYERYKEGTLDDYYDGQLAREPAVTQGLQDGSLLFDFTLHDFFRGQVGQGYADTRERNGGVVTGGHGPREGIVTLADSNYFEGLKLLCRSVTDCYPVPVLCFDLGLTVDQKAWCRTNFPDLAIEPLPDLPEIAVIREGLDGPPLAKREKRQWPLWICPFLIGASPFRRVFWIDCDVVVLRNLAQLFSMLEDGPVFTPENNAPDKTPNHPSLYEFLPIDRPFDHRLPAVNGGVSGWDLLRDGDALAAYQYPVRRALADDAIRNAIAWHDQGCLIWAIQSLGLEHRVATQWAWNLCVKHTAAAGHHYRWTPGVLEEIEPVIAEDFAHAIRGSITLSAIDWEFQTIPIAGRRRYLESGDPAALAIRTPEPRVLEFDLEVPAPFLFQMLGVPYMGALPTHRIRELGAAWSEPQHSVSSGPLRIVRFEPGKHIEMIRNERYTGRFTGNLAETHYPIGDDDELIPGFLRDEFDTAVLSPSQIGEAYREAPDCVLTGPALTTVGLIVNPLSPTLRYRELRQALAHAIDRATIARTLLHGYHFAGTGGLVPPGVLGYQDGTGLGFDPALAGKLASAWPDQLERHVRVVVPPFLMQLANAVADAWKQLLNVETEFVTWPEKTNLRETLVSDTCDIVLFAAHALVPDPISYLELAGCGGDESVCEQIAQVEQVHEFATRTRMTRELDRRIVEDARCIPLFYPRGYILSKPWVEHFVVMPFYHGGALDAVVRPQAMGEADRGSRDGELT